MTYPRPLPRAVLLALIAGQASLLVLALLVLHGPPWPVLQYVFMPYVVTLMTGSIYLGLRGKGADSKTALRRSAFLLAVMLGAWFAGWLANRFAFADALGRIIGAVGGIVVLWQVVFLWRWRRAWQSPLAYVPASRATRLTALSLVFSAVGVTLPWPNSSQATQWWVLVSTPLIVIAALEWLGNASFGLRLTESGVWTFTGHTRWDEVRAYEWEKGGLGLLTLRRRTRGSLIEFLADPVAYFHSHIQVHVGDATARLRLSEALAERLGHGSSSDVIAANP